MSLERDSTPKLLKRGFTLIELLIVVAIILILISIALPNLMAIQARAKVARESADMHTLAAAIEAMRIDYGFLLVDFWDDDSPEIVATRFIGYPESGEPPRFWACCSWHRRDLRGGTTGLFTPLTTPTRYLLEVPRDPFAYERADLTLIAEDVIPPISYMYHDREVADKRINRTWGDGEMLGVPYTFKARAPHGAHGITKPLGPDHFILVGFGPDMVRDYQEVIPYSPTNGVLSFGDVLYRSDTGYN
ncbi:MAG: prepilin-type N-terminal cleavage/methylation domain-containing protein [Candidatus Omnitrophica bacterium]|nr:prepilin-type N-terminal cleavage/methylation domain-containing protein [Candidatus Omnitrophota bacterium]MCA9442055.1 prepilin-type N-terminal cleavage/methylation domain-containing protein [Candidatus Omnitrophota bacterium]